MTEPLLKIGQLAARCGVSVRTLHHYDELGLLRPALGGRGEARLYGAPEFERLQQIQSLTRLGLSLAEVGQALDAEDFEPLPLLERHIARLEAQLEAGERLRARLRELAQRLRKSESPRGDELLNAIDAMNEMDQIEKYYTPEQREFLQRRAEQVGPERIAAVQREWGELFAELAQAQARGDAPDSPSMRALAERSLALVEEFTGGDPGVRDSLSRMYADKAGAAERWGFDGGLMQFLGEAQRALRGAEDEDAPRAR